MRKSEIKAVFLDFDGTIYSNGNIAESTLQALEMLREKNILTILATGRHRSDIDCFDEANKYGLYFDADITMNGQLCMIGDEVVHEHKIPIEDIKYVKQRLRQESFPCVFMEKEFIGSIAPIKECFQYVHLYQSMDEIKDEDVYQIVAFVDPILEEDLLSGMHGCRSTRWHERGIDIIPQNGSKKMGMEKVMEYFQLEREQIMAFGDGKNDIEMLSFAGVGVAMGNASDLVKGYADEVCEDAKDGGIYQTLKRRGLI